MDSDHNSPRWKYIVCLFLVVTTLAVYFQVGNHAFINLDDDLDILNNPYVRNGLTSKGVIWAFSSPGIDYWRPLTWLSHMLDCHLYGLNPGMHHQTSLILHVVNSMVLFLVFKWMTGAVWRSAFVASLFALHPLNVESVAWVAERKNVLSTFFWLFTALTYIYYSKRPNFYRYLLICFVFALGLMSKPMLVTLPFVFLLLDYWPLCRIKLAQPEGDHREFQGSTTSGFQSSPIIYIVLEKIPLVILSVIGIFLSALSVQRLGIVISTDYVPITLRISNALVSYIIYIIRMIWPHNLAVYYPFPQTIQWWKVAGACALLLCISAFVLREARSKPYLVVGWLWYIGTLVPAIGLVQAGLWPAIADRFAYVPLVGLFLIIAWFFTDLVSLRPHRKVLLATLAMLYLTMLMALTWKQVRYWENSTALFDHTLNVTTDNYYAHMKLGEALAEQNKNSEAIRHYLEALRINPDFAQVHFNLGNVHASLGNTEDAVYYYNEALQKKPNFAKAHNNLGNTMARLGNYGAAVYNYNEALKINPDYAGAYYNLGRIAANLGKIEDAILHYRKASLLNPIMTEALYNLSWIFSTHHNEQFRNGEEAVKLAERLCKITQYNQPLALDALAAAYAETGQFDAAVSAAQKALGLALVYGPEALDLGLKKRLQLYQAGRPYRQKKTEKGNSVGMK